uniref:Uncharacterized protein n=1 Tax=Rhabditophanes sp. KR3021 TaxID=114890 RepID=A0AC35UCX9_9BILA
MAQMQTYMSHTFLFHLRKQSAIYIWPVLASAIILTDWNHTRKWKANGEKSILDEILLESQGKKKLY